jgi:hypothetical protein
VIYLFQTFACTFNILCRLRLGKLWYMGGGFFEGMWIGGRPNGPGVLDLEEAGGERVDGRWSEAGAPAHVDSS